MTVDFERDERQRFVKLSYASEEVAEHTENTFLDWADGRVSLRQLERLFKERGYHDIEWLSDDSPAAIGGEGWDDNNQPFRFELLESVGTLPSERDVPAADREFDFTISFGATSIEAVRNLLLNDWRFSSVEFDEAEMMLICIDGEDRDVYVHVAPVRSASLDGGTSQGLR